MTATGQNIHLVEVGPRDGLQNEKAVLSTEDKLEFIRLLALAGHKTVEVTSFVKASSIPQMADATELFEQVNKASWSKGINLPCLVPNMKGYEVAKALGVNEMALFSATSEEFSKRNVNASVAETFVRMAPIAQEAKKDGIKLRAYVSTAFGCPYEGDIPLKKLMDVITEFLKLGVYEVSVGDTTGVAKPNQVKAALQAMRNEFGLEKMAMHFHDTRGMALANILVSIESGITTFDASSGGLGGCPYAKGATGNVATEDVWYLCHSLGLETGVDLPKLAQASQFILNKVGKPTESKFLRAYLNTGKI